MDERPVTAAEFRTFVRATKYVTVAERPVDPEHYPEADPELLVPGSLAFRKTEGPVSLGDVRDWWEYVPGAYWERPEGPGSTVNGRDRHPIVQVAFEDAQEYARWAGRNCRPRRNGSTRPAAAWRAPFSRRGTRSPRTARRWRTPGRASFRSRT